MSAPALNPERLPAKVSPAKVIKFDEVERMSKSISPQLFGMKNAQEVCTLMMLGLADGIHPITALRRYHIIDGKPSMKADAMLACFLEAGGKVKWLVRTDKTVRAEFSYRDQSIIVEWGMERAKQAGLAGRKNWMSYPCQMLTARVISEGLRLIMPQIVTGIYTPEEVMDIDASPRAKNEPEQKEVVDVDPVATSMDQDQIAEVRSRLTEWINSVLMPDKFVRSSETEAFGTYREQIIADGNGLPEEEIVKLRAMAYERWLSCMIHTRDEMPAVWEEKIAKSGLAAEVKKQLKALLEKSGQEKSGGEPGVNPQEAADAKAVTPAPQAGGPPEWVQTWLNRINATNRHSLAVGIWNEVLEDYIAAPDPDQDEHFPGIFQAWLDHALEVANGKGLDQIAKKLQSNHELPAAIIGPLLEKFHGAKAA